MRSLSENSRNIFIEESDVPTVTDWVRGTVFAIALSLAGPVLDARGAENSVKSPVAVSKSVKVEKKLPALAYENPQIYEFLEGDITEKDTLATLQKKLGKKINTVASAQSSDDFSYYVGMEMLYRQETGKSVGEILFRAIEQIENERKAIKKLHNVFITVKSKDISAMNDVLIAYYNSVGGNTWGEKELEEWKNEIEKERKTLGYNYNDVEKWSRKMEQENKKGKARVVKM